MCQLAARMKEAEEAQKHICCQPFQNAPQMNGKLAEVEKQMVLQRAMPVIQEQNIYWLMSLLLQEPSFEDETTE